MGIGRKVEAQDNCPQQKRAERAELSVSCSSSFITHGLRHSLGKRGLDAGKRGLRAQSV